MPTLPHTRSCYVCGLQNGLGFRLDLTEENQVVESRFQFKPEHCGFPEVVHGGQITTILDEMMAWAIGVSTKRFAYCAELNVRFVRPVSPGIDVIARGKLVENKRGRLYFAEAQILGADGDLMAEAHGKFLPLPESGQKAMRLEFLEDPTSVLGPPS